MTNQIIGGQTTYGHIVGILVNESVIPRIPGDPGHAETFPFPVIYETLNGFPFEDLISLKKDRIGILIEHAKVLQKKGVSLIVTNCGLFAPFQSELKKHIDVPFIGSALDIIPFLQKMFPADFQLGIITGDTRILKSEHLAASNINPREVVITGMENCPEFTRTVIKQAQALDIDKMRKGVLDAALKMSEKKLAAVVLECTNLIPFRSDIQKLLGIPVFDLVTLINFFVSGVTSQTFRSRFNR